MTLVNRLSLFFLAALAVVLVIYSLITYLSVRDYLMHRFDEQLHGAFNTLVAAIEVEADDVKFESTDHTIRLGVEADVDDIRWAIYDERQQLVACSQNLADASQPQLLQYSRELRGTSDDTQVVDDWRLLQHRVAASAPKPASERDPAEHEALVITVARSDLDLNDNLRRMAYASILIPAIIWSFAAAAGRWLCGRALAPVRSMAEQARQLAAAPEGAQLQVAASGDELAELGTAFNQLLARMHSALERQQRFAGDAAHQLRTPLTILQGQIEVALRRERSATELRATLAALLTDAQGLTELVESLLFLARAESAAPTDLQEVELTSWLKKYVTRWQSHPRASDVVLQASDVGRITTSPQLLSQLLDNLVSNALKYSEPGTPVTIACESRAHEILLSVSDRGTGISPTELEAIFDPFFRSPAARQSGATGVGLGLAISRRLAQALGGTLTCDSTLDQGSVFAVTLPDVTSDA